MVIVVGNGHGDPSLNHERLIWFGLVWFYDISTFVGYLMPNPFLYNKQLYLKQFSLE